MQMMTVDTISLQINAVFCFVMCYAVKANNQYQHVIKIRKRSPFLLLPTCFHTVFHNFLSMV